MASPLRHSSPHSNQNPAAIHATPTPATGPSQSWRRPVSPRCRRSSPPRAVFAAAAPSPRPPARSRACASSSATRRKVPRLLASPSRELAIASRLVTVSFLQVDCGADWWLPVTLRRWRRPALRRGPPSGRRAYWWWALRGRLGGRWSAGRWTRATTSGALSGRARRPAISSGTGAPPSSM